MKSILTVLLTLLAMVGVGAALTGDSNWVQDKVILSGGVNMESQTLWFEGGEAMIQINTPVGNTAVMQDFASRAVIDDPNVQAVYFRSDKTVVFADGTIKTNVKLPSNMPLSWSRFVHTMF
jgi:hypothetical protein